MSFLRNKRGELIPPENAHEEISDGTAVVFLIVLVLLIVILSCISP